MQVSGHMAGLGRNLRVAAISVVAVAVLFFSTFSSAALASNDSVAVGIATSKSPNDIFFRYQSPADNIELQVSFECAGSCSNSNYKIVMGRAGEPSSEIAAGTISGPGITRLLTSAQNPALGIIPDGYETGAYYFTVTTDVPADSMKSNNASTVYVRISDEKTTVVPETGGFPFIILIALAVLAVAARARF